jgi:hypothetical protein
MLLLKFRHSAHMVQTERTASSVYPDVNLPPDNDRITSMTDDVRAGDKPKVVPGIAMMKYKRVEGHKISIELAPLRFFLKILFYLGGR